MKKRLMKKLIPEGDFCSNCPLRITIGKMEDALCLPDGTEKQIFRSKKICKYTKITNEENVDFDEGLKVCYEKMNY